MQMRMARILGYAGLIPFVLVAVGHLLGRPVAGLGLAYGAVILSFLGGIQWGTALRMDSGQHRLVASVVPSLIGWMALMFTQPFSSVMLIGGLAGQWLYDWRHQEGADWPEGFMTLRTHLSLGAGICLAALLV